MRAAALSIRLLGGFTVTVGDRPVPDAAWNRRKAAELVKLLALAPRHRLPREQVIDALWPGTDPVSGGPRLRKAAFHARRALGLADGVALAGGLVSLAPGRPVRTDAEDFGTAAEGALRSRDGAACRKAAALYGGELLPEDRYASWCESERARLRTLYRETLAAGRLWGLLVSEDPTDEGAHLEIMRSHLEHGDRSAAIRQFGELRGTLDDVLGISPSQEILSFYETVLATEAAPAPTPAERARALLAWAAVHRERSDLAEAERTAREVRALAVDAGLPAELTEASEILGLVAYGRGTWPEVFAHEFLTTLLGSPDLSPFLFDANMCMSEFALGEEHGTVTVAALAEQMLAEGERLGSPPARALGRLLRGEAGLLADRPAGGVRDDLAAADRSWGPEAVTGRALSAVRLAQLADRQGDHDTARAGHREALALARRSAIPEHLLPCVYGAMLESAAPSSAHALLSEAERDLDGRRICDPCAMTLRVEAARLCARAGEPARGRTFLDRAEPVAQMWSGGPWHAAVLEARADLARGDGQDEDVIAGLLAPATAGFEASGRPREAARCRRAAPGRVVTGDVAPGPGNAAGTAPS